MYMKKASINSQRMDIEKLIPLINLSIEGDKSAVEALTMNIYGYIKRRSIVLSGSAEFASDLAHDVLIKIIRGLPKLKHAGAFFAWTEKILKNEYYDSLKKKNNRFNDYIPIESENDAGSVKAEQFDRMNDKETMKILSIAMKRLSPKEQNAFFLRQYEGMNSKEIGQAMGINASTARVLYRRAGTKLAKILDDYRSGGIL